MNVTLVSGIILLASLALLAQFALFYWRALMEGIAAQPLSERIRYAAGLSRGAVGQEDFSLLVNLAEICPDLSGRGRGVGSLNIYFRTIAALEGLSKALFPTISAWANREMATCARYAAVVVDQRLERNSDCLAEIFSH